MKLHLTPTQGLIKDPATYSMLTDIADVSAPSIAVPLLTSLLEKNLAKCLRDDAYNNCNVQARFVSVLEEIDEEDEEEEDAQVDLLARCFKKNLAMGTEKGVNNPLGMEDSEREWVRRAVSQFWR